MVIFKICSKFYVSLQTFINVSFFLLLILTMIIVILKISDESMDTFKIVIVASPNNSSSEAYFLTQNNWVEQMKICVNSQGSN